jgi:hypothetical protein
LPSAASYNPEGAMPPKAKICPCNFSANPAVTWISSLSTPPSLPWIASALLSTVRCNLQHRPRCPGLPRLNP